MSISIIYEDNDIIAVNKPAGMPVHPDKTHKEGTLIQEIIKLHPGIKKVGDSPDGERSGVVHRLDKDTSGVLIIAKNQSAFEYLKSLFKNRKIVKKYIALVEGEIKNNSGIINLPIGRSRSDFRKKLALPAGGLTSWNAKGELREAITEYKILERFINVQHSVSHMYTLVEAYPKTGRTHQIRVHFKAIGHPVVCDALYGGKKARCPFGLGRHFLHANFLEFTAPSGIKLKLEAGLPDDLETTLQSLRKNK